MLWYGFTAWELALDNKCWIKLDVRPVIGLVNRANVKLKIARTDKFRSNAFSVPLAR
jgi:hypothetical protein